MTAFAIAHPFICLTGVFYLIIVGVGWAFLAGAAKLNEEPPSDVGCSRDGDARAAHRAAVEAGYADLAGYVAKYGDDQCRK